MPTYRFGHNGDAWKCSAPNLNAAVRMFRVAALFPATYASLPEPRTYEWHGRTFQEIVSGYAGEPQRIGGETRYLEAQSGAVIRVYEDQGQEPVAMIPVWDVAVEAETLALLGQIPDFSAEAAPTTTALAPRAASHGRASTETALVKLHAQMAALETQRQALQAQAATALAAAKLQLQNVWLIELYVGSAEQVIVLRDGAGSEADVSLFQRTLCMDEEVAAFAVFHDVEWSEDDTFDYKNIGAFDDWLLADPRHLDQIIPAPKGVRALRVRRREKHRESRDIGEAMANGQMAEWDRGTHLYVRNGERLYRVSVDVDLWPRLFMAAADVPDLDADDGLRARRDAEAAQRQMKRYFAGMLALQGIIQRSTLLDPLTEPRPNVLAPMPEGVVFVRDDEPLTQKLLADKDAEWLRTLTWRTYEKWLREQLVVGVRVMLTHTIYCSPDPRSSHSSWEERTRYTGGKDGTPPRVHEVYTIDHVGEHRRLGGRYEILIPRGSRWGRDGELHPSSRRVRFCLYEDEIIPIDLVSPRVLRYLIADRTHRAENHEAFWLMRRWFRRVEAERMAEKPFIDLVLVQAGADPNDDHARARAERLLRWWKLKVREHRTVGTDEAKALRMIVAAFQRGDDHENDPEVQLMRALRTEPMP